MAVARVSFSQFGREVELHLNALKAGRRFGRGLRRLPNWSVQWGGGSGRCRQVCVPLGSALTAECGGWNIMEGRERGEENGVKF